MATIMYIFLGALAITCIVSGLLAWRDVRTDKDLKSRDEIKYPRSWEKDDWFGM